MGCKKRCNHARSAHFSDMAAMNPRTADRPSRGAVVLAFGVAIAAAVALVLVAVLLRNDPSSPSATAAPVVDLSGIPQDDRVLGSADARVTLIEYADPQCPACRAYTESIFPTVVDDYVRPGRIDTEFRGFPFIGEDSVKAYRFLLAAGLQNKLWNLQEAMYRHQGGENSGWVTDDLVRELASAIPGLDVDKLFADASSPAIVQEADGAGAAAQAAGIKGTPTLLVEAADRAPYVIQVADAAQMRAALNDAIAG
jgi:protein-disulfide isomerase